MDIQEGKQRFIQAWGTLGSSWGINRTMSQIHALLLMNTEPMSAEDVMEELKVSRGNVNMNMRALIDWGLVNKELIPGERKEYFNADKDVPNIARQIARERRKRELAPILHTMEELKGVKGKGEDVAHFKDMVSEIEGFASLAEGAMDKFIRSDKNWFVKVLMRAMK